MKRLIHKILLVLTIITLGSCSSVKLADADMQMERGEYFDASKSYKKIYSTLKSKDQRKLRGEVAFKMAECYRLTGRKANASAAYRNALRYGYPDSVVILRLAQSQHSEGNYKAAIENYECYLHFDPSNIVANAGLAGARKSAELKKNKTRYVVKPAKIFNSRRSDYSPMYNGDLLYLTTTNEQAKGTKKSEVTGMKQGDVWVARKDDNGRWLAPLPVEGELNTESDEGVVSFSPDGTTMYLSRVNGSNQYDSRAEIYVSHRSDAQWSDADKMNIGTDTLYSYAHPAVSPSGEYLYFTSDRPGFGGKDIWRISLADLDLKPVNLGDEINTPGNEMFPYLLTDSVMLFASDGHPGLGGLDLFRASLTPSGNWKVENMGSPINSEGDDFGITYSTPGREAGFLSSNRGDRRGYDHIYSFELPDIKITLSGHVFDKDEEPLSGAIVRVVGNDGTNQKTATRPDGSFTLPLERGVKYVMMAGAEGHLNDSQAFQSHEEEADADYAIDFYLASLIKPNIIENIFYDFDKASLRPESEKVLDEVVQMMCDNPEISIEMGSHTDRHGSESYNENLSLRRAHSVVDYLVRAGITADRLKARGYGKTVPKVITKRLERLFPQFPEGQILDEEYISTLPTDLQEIADQINRRTEFRIM
ncbi:MAG: OmpA family protein [Duncaniella sp.]|nr:OmpA family protein [Duncaniella sp.]